MGQVAPNRPLAAAVWMIGSIGAFTTMAISGRMVSAAHDTFEIMTWRSLVGLILVLGFATSTGRLSEIRRDRVGSHLVRNIFHFTGQNLWFWALGLIPLTQLISLEFTSPVWVVLLAAVFLGERLTWMKIAAGVLGFAGVWVVAQPDFAALNAGVVAAAASAIFFAASAIMTKALTKGESIVSILFWLTLIQLCLGLITSGIDGDIRLPTAQTLPWLVMIGVAGIVAHMCLTAALALAPASIVVPIDFARLPVFAVVGWLLFNESIEATVAVGAAMIFASILMNLRASSRAAAQQPDVTKS